MVFRFPRLRRSPPPIPPTPFPPSGERGSREPAVSRILSAPGKVFLAGEYAVLEGHPALVAGVDRRIHATVERVNGVHLMHRPSGAQWSPPAPPPPELRFAARAFTLAGGRDLRVIFEDDFSFG